jgi:mersacidin/lichenicidin family type 2 lantibiotic
MTANEIVRAWKDEEYLSSLNASDRAGLPADPAGAIEISDRDLGDVSGGTTWPCATITVSVAVSVAASCIQSAIHGTCGAFSYGCCTPHFSDEIDDGSLAA